MAEKETEKLVEPTTETASPGKKSKIRIGLFLFVSLPAIMLIAVLILVSLITGKPASYPLPLLSAEAMSTQWNVFQRIYPEIIKETPPEQAELELTAQEVAHLLAIARNAHALSHTMSPTEIDPLSYRIEYRDHRFLLNYSYRYGSMNFNFYAEAVPDFGKDGITIKPSAFKVCKLRLPQSILTSSTEAAIRKLKNNDDYKRLAAIIVSAEVMENGNLKIVYRPAKLAKFLWNIPK